MTIAEVKLILYLVNLGTDIAIDFLNQKFDDDEEVTDEMLKALYVDLPSDDASAGPDP